MNNPRMNQEIYQFLTLRWRPARLRVRETAWLLGFSEEDIVVLVKAGLLKPLGKPVQNAVRYYARSEIELLATDSKWLDRACATLGRHWRTRNERFRGKNRAAAITVPNV